MKFPAESLAVIVSKARGSQDYDVGHFMANANQQDRGLLEETSSSLSVKNGKSLSEMASTILSKLRDLQDVVECDPNVEIHEERRLKNHHGHNTDTFDGDMEFGILSSVCGVGRTCDEGVCANVEDWTLGVRTLQANIDIVNTGPPDSVPTQSTDEDDSLTLGMAALQYACDVGGLVGYDCDCNFESDFYLGNITCTTPVKCKDQTSVCDVEISDCSQTTLNFVLKGEPGFVDGEYCKQYLEPFEQTVCYQTSTVDYGKSVLPDCKILLDGEECSSCDAYKVGAEDCFNFDCSNTALAGDGRGPQVGNTCGIPVNNMGLFLETYGCPLCDLCGDTMGMTTPTSMVELLNATFECDYVQLVAQRGYFNTESCMYISSISKEPCGCSATANEIEDVAGTESPTSISIANGAFCNVCPDGVSSPNNMLSMPGSKEILCSEIETAGFDGSIVGEELCQAVQDRAAGPCCGAQTVEENDTTDVPVEPSCSLCGPGKYHTKDINALVSVPTQGIYTCGELIELGENGTLDADGICLLVQLSANTPCGCVIDGPTMSPSAMDVGDAYAVPSAATRVSLATVLAIVGGSTMLSYFW